MSLRRWLLLWIVGVNLLVLAALQGISAYVYRQWMVDQHAIYEANMKVLLADSEIVNPRWVRKILSTPELATWCLDLVISTGREAQASGYVDLNPFGAANRDPERFPMAEIHRGLQLALDTRSTVRAAGGFCVSTRAGPQGAAAAWYVPVDPQPPIGFALLAVWVVAGLLLLGVVTWRLERMVVQPLAQLTDAASRLGSGDLSARSHLGGVAMELVLLSDTFDRMADQVMGHTQELRKAVAEATEEALRRERVMVSSSRLASIGTLASGIAHEINNPIGGMLNAVRRLQRNPDLAERDRTYLQMVHEGLERVARITRRVLDFSPREVAGTRFSLAPVVEAARALVEYRLQREGVQFESMGLEDVQLDGDPHEIQQVLLNLFLNSLDAIEGLPGPHKIQVQVERKAGVIVLRVDDDGPGMATELLPRVFDPFYSKKSRPDATGLGMFISYSILRNHGGRIELDSAPGQGFHVRIELPDPGAGPVG